MKVKFDLSFIRMMADGKFISEAQGKEIHEKVLGYAKDYANDPDMEMGIEEAYYDAMKEYFTC